MQDKNAIFTTDINNKIMSKKENTADLEIKKAPEELTQNDLDKVNGGSYYRYVMMDSCPSFTNQSTGSCSDCGSDCTSD